eukprot:CAMPEP_0185745582 /NCGR_PEP_ID=MMETSP1174-20130828/3965_1 /TAXON_ID=35687 /ORGANISM="Dictyocha speculum, Strain CCMP1381" /LENGTH=94 /DNA_ID=CAMNT_0028419695 /DNA_START=409 /DNA_END=689 /DNA_ORIENTATION=+
MATSGGSSLGYAPVLSESPWSPLERTTDRYDYYNGLRDELLEFDGPDFYRTQSQARLTSSDKGVASPAPSPAPTSPAPTLVPSVSSGPTTTPVP